MKKDLLKGINAANKRNIVQRMVSMRKNELHLTQPQLAERLGYSQTYISLVESGERELTSELLSAFVQEFRPSKQWIMYGAGDPFWEDANKSDLHVSEILSSLRGPCSLSDDDEKYLLWYLTLTPEDRKKVILLKETAVSLPRMQ